MWQCIMTNSAGIQAVAAVLGFLGLCFYALDTRKIRQATSLQAKDNLIAFLALSQLPKDGDPSVLQWKLQNQGSGTAINIKVWLLNNPTPKQKPSLMKGESFVICDVDDPNAPLFAKQLKSVDGFKTQYESLAGERFESTFKLKDKDTVDVSFKNLSRL
jgi:hypothetical protein